MYQFFKLLLAIAFNLLPVMSMLKVTTFQKKFLQQWGHFNVKGL